MKKTTFWALLFTAFTCIHCFGQPLSNIYSYPSEQGTNLHIRSLNAGKDLIYHCTNTIYHTFLCQPDLLFFSNSNMNMYKYTIPPFADINGGVNYTVADMHVVGNVCYICGKMTSTVGSHWGGSGYVYDFEDNGYFARIDLDSISKVIVTIHPLADSTSRSLQPSPNIKISFCKLPYTKEVSKMCVSVSNGDTLIALVGRSSDSPAGPCLTALKKNATNWDHQWIKVNDPLEYFTDVVFTSKSLFTASRFEDDHYSLGVRFVNIAELFETYNSTEFKTLNKFNTQGMYYGSVEPTWRLNDDPIHMVAIPGDNDVVLGHEGRFYPQGHDYFYEDICLYYISGDQSNVTMTNAFSLNCHPSEERFLFDMQYIPEQSCIGVLGSVLEGIYHDTYLSLFNWSTTVHIAHLWTDKAVAMDVHNGRVSLLGNRTSNNALFHYREKSSLINQPPQCVLQDMSYSRKIYGNAALTTSESIISHTINYPQLDWHFNFRVTPTTVESSAVCQE